MQQSAKKQDTSNIPFNVEEQDTNNKNYPLVNMEQIQGTPFHIVEQNNKWFLVMGDHRITEPTANRETTMLKLENEKWMIQLHMTVIITNRLLKDGDYIQKPTEEEWKQHQEKWERDNPQFAEQMKHHI